MHKEHKVYVPELIFGHLLTSSNYDDDEKKGLFVKEKSETKLYLPCEYEYLFIPYTFFVSFCSHGWS